MKTLVIHPKDRTTEVLSKIYENHKEDWTIVTDYNISESKLKKLIKKHDRIIMLGHGTPMGLLNPKYGGLYRRFQFSLFIKEKKGMCSHLV